jgi:anti-sigma factor RsiW
MNKTPSVTSEQFEFEQFELLSAYLDGEVSAAERKQVEVWLDTDPKLRQTYQRLLTLQSGLKAMPIEAPSIQPEQLARNVMKRVDRSRRRWIWGGIGTAAAVAMGALSGLGQSWDMKTAQQPLQGQPTFDAPSMSTMKTDPNDPNATFSVTPNATLMIALERPPVAIPIVPGSEFHRKQGIGPTSEF